ncbi:UPF0764 protein C16orf89 homolog [Diabrotica undecimpunctata]|uniref:UPF0764 protein C16orf89 homolog n=1 Tax=Diabrotica undecimpunctata TaxID=50387 RepID=UPI003B63C5F6
MSGILSCLFLCFVVQTGGHSLDKRVILKVKQGIEKTLEYLDAEYKRINEDCLLGVVLSTAIIHDAYKNGTHIMDRSSKEIIDKSQNLLQKSLPLIKSERKWTINSILDSRIWSKEIHYKYNQIDTFLKSNGDEILKGIYHCQDDELFLSNMDRCLMGFGNKSYQVVIKKCYIYKSCWDLYYKDDHFSTGYMLTHKLLLLQLAKGRNCLINKTAYKNKVRQLCSQIFVEVTTGDKYDVLDDMFDLFLEESLLCAFEGYTEFLSNKWLFYILKSQRPSGCFPVILTDKLKSKIKRTTNIFEDNCADHTTGLGLAVLSLYYNFIVKTVFG